MLIAALNGQLHFLPFENMKVLGAIFRSFFCIGCGYIPYVFVRYAFYLLFYVFFACFLYLETSRNTQLIACGVLMVCIFIILLVLWVLNYVLNYLIDVSDDESVADIRPPEIKPEVWQYKSILENVNTDIDAVVGDIIGSGEVAVDDLLSFVDWLRDRPREERVQTEKRSRDNIVHLCGRYYHVRFSREDLLEVFPCSNHSISYVFLSVILSFGAAYLPLSLREQFPDGVKWWVAFVCSTAIYSVIDPAPCDVMVSTVGDYWAGCSRAVSLEIVCGVWRLFLEMYQRTDVTVLPFFDWELRWSVIYAYVHDICFYGVVLFPFWVLLGLVGHPLTVLMAIIEAFNRYVFGQAGAAGWIHGLVQLARGVACVAAVWAVLDYKYNEFTIAGAICLATFMGSFPIIWTQSSRKHWFSCYLWPILSSGFAFLFAWGALKQKIDIQKGILWGTLGLSVAVNIVFPMVLTIQHYHLLDFAIMPIPVHVGHLMTIFNLAIATTFTAVVFSTSQLNVVIISVAIVHAIQKALTEPHIFTLAVAMALVTFPEEYMLPQLDMGFCVGLIIAAKLEVVYDLFKYIINVPLGGRAVSSIEGDCFLSLLTLLFATFWRICPTPAWCWKILAAAWSFVTGSCLGLESGFAGLSLPSFPRPFYFADWPVRNTTIQKDLKQNVTEHAAEVPIFISARQDLSRVFANMARFARLGYVNCGSMFLFQSDPWVMFVQVVAIEPTICKIQVRGLEYVSQTVCHQNELRQLSTVRNDKCFPAAMSVIGVVQPRKYGVELDMYTAATVNFNDALIGCTPPSKKWLLMSAFCFYINKRIFPFSQIQSIDGLPQDERTRDELARLLHYFGKDYAHDQMTVINAIWCVFRDKLVDPNGTLHREEFASTLEGGRWNLPDSVLWIYDIDVILHGIFTPAARLGLGLMLMNSAGLSPDIGEDVLPDEIMADLANFTREVKQEYVVTSVDSKLFEKHFLLRKKSIIALDRRPDLSFVRFQVTPTEWSVFQLNPVAVHALWAGETRSMVANQLSGRGNERNAIQMDTAFFNNMIIQACDRPIGWPAYVSGFFDSVMNPVGVHQCG